MRAQLLAGRVAIVTGGTRGLGKAIATGLSGAGANVVVTGRTQESCHAAAAAITKETGVPVTGIAHHAGDWDGAERLMDFVLSRFGKLDVLVNNAGISPGYSLLSEVTKELWHKTFEVNVDGPFRLCVLAGAAMKEGGRGSIINIGSTAARLPRPDLVPYAASKAAFTALSLGLVHAYAPEVRVNVIEPGAFATDMTSGWSEEATAERVGHTGVRRLGRPEDIVGGVVLLASDEAAYISGSVLTIDGGNRIYG